MRKLTLILLAIFLTISMKARAGVIAHDLAAPGDGLLTYDTVNNRQWLDLPETAGVSLAEVLSQTGRGGRLEGFRFATLADVSDLAASAGVGWTTWTIGFSSEPNAPGLVELLGWVVKYSGGVSPDIDLALGLIATDNASSPPSFDDTNFVVVSTLVPKLSLGPNPNGPSLSHEPRGGVLTSGPLPPAPGQPALAIGDIGPFWIYREVPEPGAVQLQMQSLAAIIAVRCGRPRTRGAAIRPRA